MEATIPIPKTDAAAMMQIVMFLASSVFVPFVTEILKRFELARRLSNAVTIGTTTLSMAVGWYLFAGEPELLKSWLLYGLGAGGLASTLYQSAKIAAPDTVARLRRSLASPRE